MIQKEVPDLPDNEDTEGFVFDGREDSWCYFSDEQEIYSIEE